MNTWNLRDEILSITHRWYVIVIFILAGAAIGWGMGFIWPSPYRATADLYVGLNAYRSPYDTYVANVAQQEFRMVDDYKNWQMSQLNELILSESFLDETLRRLRMHDPSWGEVSIQELRAMCRVMWRNAGEWHLIVEAYRPDHATRAVDEWRDVITEKIGAAISHSQQVVALDIRMTRLAEMILAYETRQAELAYADRQLKFWAGELGQMSAGRILTSSEHWEILGPVSQAADWNPVWDEVLDDSPGVGSSAAEYGLWLEGILTLIDEERSLLPEQIGMLQAQFAEVETEYIRETEQSLGLASTLVLQPGADPAPNVEQVRPTGVAMLVGAVMGLAVWGIWFLVRISQREEPV